MSLTLPPVTQHATTDFYWGILPREEMRRFVAQADREGFAQAHKTFVFSMPFDYAEHFDRADFLYFLPLAADAKVLDLGSGFGNVTIPVSAHCGEVVAADASRELLDLLRVRARDNGCRNISFAHIDPLGSGPLPFADATFDCVLLNGVLEWTGLSDESRSPNQIQATVLAEVRRVLKDGGIAYVGIENRWFPGWLGRDPHSKLPWTSVMPRTFADWYCRRKGLAQGYRTYIYGWRAYRRLFTPHLRFVSALIPFASYRYPRVIYPKNKEASAYLFGRGFGSHIYTRKWQTLLRILYWIGAEHWFVSSYMFILRKGEDPKEGQPTVFTRILCQSHPETYRASDTLITRAGEDFLEVQAIRAGARAPYGVYRLKRSLKNEGEVAFEPFADLS